MLIIGAGQAGASAACALRQLGFEGLITLVGEEDVAPYERPPLSKAVLLDPAREAEAFLHPSPLRRAWHYPAAWRQGAVELDPGRHRAVLAGGRALGYSKCLLATGGRARELTGHPSGRSERPHYIRTLADAQRLRAQLHALAASPAAADVQLLVLGAGFLGLEFASTALQLGVKAVVVEPGAVLLARAVPPGFSDWLARAIQGTGVDLRLGVGCDALGGLRAGMQASLTDGHGSPPPVSWLRLAKGQHRAGQ